MVQGWYTLVHGWYKAPHEREGAIGGEKTLWMFHVMVRFEPRMGVMEGWGGGLERSFLEGWGVRVKSLGNRSGGAGAGYARFGEVTHKTLCPMPS